MGTRDDGVLQRSSSSCDWLARNGERDRTDYDCTPRSEHPSPRHQHVGEISLSEQRFVLAKSLMNVMADVWRLLDRLPPTRQASNGVPSEGSMPHDTEIDVTHSVEFNNVNNDPAVAHDVEHFLHTDEASGSSVEEPDQCNTYQLGYVDTG